MENSKVNSPDHYNVYPMEVIDIMVAVFGEEQVAIFCQVNAFKYRMRLGLKDDLVQDFEKEQWYLDKADSLRTISDEPEEKDIIFEGKLAKYNMEL